MWKKLLGRKTKKTPQSAISTLEKLHETLDTMEKKESLLHKKIAGEIEKAKDHSKAKNKTAAIQCLKKKKLYETQIEQLGNFQLHVHNQIILLENANATTETVNALRRGTSAVKSIHQSLSVDDIDRTMEQVNEHAENMKQIQEALAAPAYAGADFDEDELEAELEGMEELEELLQPPPLAVRTPSPAAEHLPKRATPQPSAEVDELASRQAEMAI